MVIPALLALVLEREPVLVPVPERERALVPEREPVPVLVLVGVLVRVQHNWQ